MFSILKPLLCWCYGLSVTSLEFLSSFFFFLLYFWSCTVEYVYFN